MKKAYYKLTQNPSAKQPFHFVLVAPNHETILNSESYTTKQSALNGIDSVIKNSPIQKNFTILTASNNQPYFVLKAQNGEIIGVSETYSSMQMCENGISSVMKYGKIAEILDSTQTATY